MGPIRVPGDLAPFIEGVFGLDDRPQARPLGQIIAGGAAAAPAVSYTPSEVAKLYNFPTAGNGAGQSIALFEFGGGYYDTDLRAYFAQLNILPPPVVSVSVDGARNAPTGDPNNGGEVTADIEKAQLHPGLISSSTLPPSPTGDGSM